MQYHLGTYLHNDAVLNSLFCGGCAAGGCAGGGAVLLDTGTPVCMPGIQWVLHQYNVDTLVKKFNYVSWA